MSPVLPISPGMPGSPFRPCAWWCMVVHGGASFEVVVGISYVNGCLLKWLAAQMVGCLEGWLLGRFLKQAPPW